MQHQSASLRQQACQRIWFAGAGELARVLYCYLMDVQATQETAVPVAGFLDNLVAKDPQQSLRYLDEQASRLPVLPFTDFVPSEGDIFICALARPEHKKNLLPPLLAKGARFLTLIHPTAIVQHHVNMEQGCVLFPGATIHNASQCGAFCTLFNHVVCGHNVTLGTYSTLFARSTLLGNVTVEDGVSVYTGGTVFPGVNLGGGCVVAAHSVISKSVPALATASGSPARIFFMHESIRNKHIKRS